MNRYLLLLFILLTACSGATSPQLFPTNMPSTASADRQEPIIEFFHKGEPVTFRLDGPIYYCTNDPANYSIAWLNEDGQGYPLSLSHSCLGFVGSGVDQFCQDGQVQTVYVGQCSDSIMCWEQQASGTLTWDQMEYVRISEECSGKTISHEEKQQVPEGKYRISVNVLRDGKVATRVIKEFIILPDIPGKK